MLEDRETHIDKTGPREVAWFVGLWVLGVGAVLLLSLLIKLVI
jgi:hypothetical protein